MLDLAWTICAILLLGKTNCLEASIEVNVDEVTTSTVALTWHGGTNDASSPLLIATLEFQRENQTTKDAINIEIQNRRYEFTRIPDGTRCKLTFSDGNERKVIFVTTARCPSGWKGFRNSCYKSYGDEAVDRRLASQRCSNILSSAHLADPRTSEEYQFMTGPDILPPESLRLYWIGITMKSGDTAMYTDGSLVGSDVKEFRGGQKWNTQEMRCVALNPPSPRWIWKQIQCIASAYYVCEYPVPQPTDQIVVDRVTPTKAEISWEEPISLFGSKFSSYSIHVRQGDQELISTKTLVKENGRKDEVTGLTDGSVFHVTVTADDENGGTSAEMPASVFITAPFPPRELQYDVNFDRISLNWQGPEMEEIPRYLYLVRYDDGKKENVEFTEYLSINLSSLIPHTQYNVSVHSAVSHVINGDNVETVSVSGQHANIQTDVSPPFEFRVVEESLRETEFTVAWLPAIGKVDQYHIGIKREDGLSNDRQFVVDSESNRFDFEGLISGATYDIYVYTTADDKESRREILKQTTRPPPVKEVFERESTVDSAEFAIVAPKSADNAIFDGYQLSFQNVRTSEEMIREFGVNSNKLVRKLTPGARYQVSVYTTSRETLSSPPFKFNLSLDVDPPKDFRPSFRNETVILMSWTPSQGEVTQYLVTCDKCTDKAKMLGFNDGNSVSFEELDPGGLYKFAIQARNDDRDDVPHSTKVSYFARTRPNAPSIIAVTDRDETSAFLTWSTATGIRDGYLVEYFALYGQSSAVPVRDGDAYVSDDSGLAMNTSLSDLVPGISYGGSIRTMMDDTPSSPVNFTFSTKPNSVENVEIVDLGEYWCVIEWNAGVGGYHTFMIEIDGLSVVNITDTEYNITLPKAATEYTAQITTIAFSGRTSESVALTILTRPLPVSELDVYEVTEESFTARWNSPKSNYDGFLIVLSGDNVEEQKRTTTSSYDTFYGLEAGTSYNLEVFATYGKSISYPVPQNATLYPFPPLVLTSTGTSSNSLSVSWEKPPGRIGSYVINWSSDLDSIREIETEMEEATLTDLTPGVTYSISVYSRSQEDLKTSETPADIMLTTDEDFPGAPESVRVEEITATSFLVQVEETATPNGIVLRYVVRYRQIYPNPEPMKFENISVSEMDILLDNVESGSLYVLSVQAHNSKGGGNWSELVFAKTLESVPGPVDDLQANATRERSLTVSWKIPKSPNGDIQFYTLSIQNESTQDVTYVTFTRDPKVGPLECFRGEEPLVNNVFGDFTPDDNKTVEEPLFQSLCPVEYILDGLLPYQRYQISVQAHTESGAGALVSTVSTTMEESPSGPPRNIMVKNVEPTTITLQWDPPEFPNGRLSYALRFYAQDEEDLFYTNKTSFTFVGMEPFSKYAVVMNCQTIAGWSNTTQDFLLLNTTEDVPSRPRGLSGQVMNSKSVYLTWDAPEYPRGRVIEYEVTIFYNQGKNVFRIDVVSPTKSNETDIIEEPLKAVLEENENIPLNRRQILPDILGSRMPDRNEKETVKYLIEGLRPYTQYGFVVKAVTSAGSGEPSDVSLTTAEDKPTSSPRNLQYRNLTSTSVNLTWSEPEDPNGAIVAYTVIYISDAGLRLEVSRQTYVVLEELKKNSLYSVYVYSKTSVGEGPSSEQLQMYTDEDAPESPPLQPRYFNVTPTVVRLEWKPPVKPNGNIRFYTIYYRNSTAEYSSKSNSTTAFLTNLKVYGEYWIRIAASTKYGDGGLRSTPLYVRTGEGEPGSPPHNLRFKDLTSTNVYLEWDEPKEPNGIIVNYEISVRIVNQTKNESFITPGAEAGFLLRDLIPYTSYLIHVRARTKHGDGGQISSPLQISTLEDAPSAPPQNLSYVNVSSTKIDVFWDDPEFPNGIITQYTVYYGGLSLNVNDSQITLNDLEPFTTYEMEVSASTLAGEGPAASISVYTEEDAPSSPPRDLTYYQISSTEITLSWLPPSAPNGIIRKYTVRYFRTDNEDDEAVIVTQDTSVSVPFLAKYTEYSASVSASTVFGDGGQIGGPIKFQTLEDAPSDPPRNLRVTTTSPTSLDMSWDPPLTPNGKIQFYTIHLEDNAGIVTTVEVFTGTDFTVSNLKKYEWYNVYVTASTGLGDGDQRSSVERIQTLEGAPDFGVEQLDAIALNSSVIKAVWLPPPVITGVISYLVGVFYQTETLVDEYTTTETELLITRGLEPYTEYYVRVTPMVLDYVGPEKIVTVTTLQDRPGAPVENLTVVSVTHTSAYLEWKETSKPNGVISAHVIQMNWGAEMLEMEGNYEWSVYLDKLFPLTNYTVAVMPATIAGRGPPALITFTTKSGVPDLPPSNIKVTNVNSRSASVSWISSEIAHGSISGYKILYSEVDKDTGYVIETSEKSITAPSSATKYNFTDLTAFTQYSLVIKASTMYGDSPGSDEVEFQTLEDVPGAPSLSCQVYSASEVSLRWGVPEEPNGEIIGYDLFYYEKSSSESTTFDLKKDTMHYDVYGLSPYTEYTFELRAVTNPGRGEPDVCSVTTREGISDAPVGLEVTASTNESVTLTWNQPTTFNGVFSHYEIYYRPAYNCWRNGGEIATIDDKQACKVKSERSDTKFRSLQTYSVYTISVGAANGAGLGKLTDEITVRTEAGVPSDPPTDVIAVAISSTEVNVTWKKPLSLAGPTSYQVQLYDDGGNLAATSDITSIGSRSAVVADLEEDTLYEATVLAITSAGSLESTAKASVRTLDDAPSDPPVNITITTFPENSSSVLVAFLPPTDPNGAVHEYNIQYKLGEDGPITTINVLDEDLPLTGKKPTYHNVSGLLGGRSYYFRMNAATLVGINEWALGTGPWSNWTEPVVIPVNPPPIPTDPFAITIPSESDDKSTTTLRVDICVFSDINGPLSNVTVIVAEDNANLLLNPTHWFEAYYMNPSPPYAVLATSSPTNFCGLGVESRKKRSTDDPFVLGQDGSCVGTNRPFCNGPLKSNTPYRMKLKATTTNGESTETAFSEPVTTGQSFLQANLYLIVGLSVGIVILVLLVSIIARCARKRLNSQSINESHRSSRSVISAGKRADVDPEHNLSFVMEPTNAKGKKAVTRPVANSVFASHVSRMSEHNDRGFQSEFEEIESVTPDGPRIVGSQPFNSAKNRFKDIIPYDHYRVKIEDVASIEGSGYINASYIPGEASPEQYIATQSPLGHTKNDFWRMIWETGSQKIVMLCNVDQEGQDNIAKYWPAISQTTYYGNLAVQTVREDRMAEWTVRTFSMAKRDKRRQVIHYHYTMWPLRGVPDNPQPFARFLHATHSSMSNQDRPVTVMCSSGSGRTAVFIALDSIFTTLAKENRVDPCGVVSELRNYRPYMIQNVTEYSFLHRCVAHIIDNDPVSSSVRSPTGDGVEETTMF